MAFIPSWCTLCFGVMTRVVGAPLRTRHALEQADAIVVLGAKLRTDGAPTATLDERVRAGVALWHRGYAPILCMTGGGAHGVNEADAMAVRARQLGVPESALRLERQARNTAENARFCAALLASDGCRRVWIVSQPFHLRRASWLFRKYGFKPLAWYPDDSLEFTRPRLGARWIAREYASMIRYFAIELRTSRRLRDVIPPM